jgi:MFS family permease
MVLLTALFVLPWAWLTFRLILGFCFAGLFVVIESWLNEQATPETRGRTFGLYMIITWLGLIGGKMMFSIAPPDDFLLFSLASVALSLSLVPVALTTGAVPQISQPTRMSIKELYRTSPIGLVGCVAVGLANGAFWAFAPLFAKAQLGSAIGVSLFMSACVVGSMLTQWPIGRFSDRTDRRLVILGVCLVAVLAGLLLLLMEDATQAQFVILAMLFGASSLSIYTLCVAHANDRADPASFVEVSSYLLLAFGLGAIFGPILASTIISEAGLKSLFAYTAGIHTALALFILFRIRVSEAIPESDRSVFAPHPPEAHGTQVIIELNPGMEQAQEAVLDDGEEKPDPNNLLPSATARVDPESNPKST